jgi:hypothetical protein
MTYAPKHHNESIVICRLSDGIAVREYHGGLDRFEKLEAAVNKERYYIKYIGEYLPWVNRQIG